MITQIIREVLLLDENVELKDEYGPNDVDSWDSLGHINIIAALEDEYDIEITPEEIQRIRTIGDIKKLMASKNIDPQE
jgi:acyl carrier protein